MGYFFSINFILYLPNHTTGLPYLSWFCLKWLKLGFAIRQPFFFARIPSCYWLRSSKFKKIIIIVPIILGNVQFHDIQTNFHPAWMGKSKSTESKELWNTTNTLVPWPISTIIILFSEMLKFSKKYFFKIKKYCEG